jgi:hypothetical protein
MRILPVVAVLALLALPACAGPGGREREPSSPDAPRQQRDAELWERKASQEITAAGKAESPSMQRLHYDNAIDDLKKARALYEDELRERASSATPSQRTALENEIDRLTRAIEQTRRDRPTGEIR